MNEKLTWKKLITVICQALIAALTALGVSSCAHWL